MCSACSERPPLPLHEVARWTHSEWWSLSPKCSRGLAICTTAPLLCMDISVQQYKWIWGGAAVEVRVCETTEEFILPHCCCHLAAAWKCSRGFRGPTHGLAELHRMAMVWPVGVCSNNRYCLDQLCLCTPTVYVSPERAVTDGGWCGWWFNLPNRTAVKREIDLAPYLCHESPEGQI